MLTDKIEQVVTSEELESLIADEPIQEKVAARLAFRHQQRMSAISDKEREWAVLIGKIGLEQVAGETLDADV